MGQGALGIECRTDAPEVLEVIKSLEHIPTAQRCYAERSFLRELEGGCQVPIGVDSQWSESQLILKGMVASLDGSRLIENEVSGSPDQAEQLGIELAGKLREQGAQEILDEILATLDRS